jgi:glycosyltransferase involved in cell wall biosynthesis
VVPSRAESLPYIVLEAAAAGMPLIATDVGGIAEIFGPDASELIAPGDPVILASAIGKSLREGPTSRANAVRLQARVAEGFSADVMTDAVLTGYRAAMQGRNG